MALVGSGTVCITEEGHDHEKDSPDFRTGLRTHHWHGWSDGGCAHGSSDGGWWLQRRKLLKEIAMMKILMFLALGFALSASPVAVMYPQSAMADGNNCNNC